MNNLITIVLLLAASLFSSCGGNTQQSKTMDSSNKIDITSDQLSITLDPVCQMHMDQHPISDTMTYNGKLYGFCSAGCKEAFKAEPEKFLSELKN